MWLWQKLGLTCYWLGWPMIWLYLHDSQRTRILLKSGDRILLVRAWLGDGTLSLPGGGAHNDETVKSTAVRELAEETGIKLQESKLKLLTTENLKHHGHRYVAHYLFVEVQDRPQPKPQFWEIMEVKWIKLSELDQHALSPDIVIRTSARKVTTGIMTGCS